MNELARSLKYNFGRVLDFSGRASRSQFWPYALFLFISSAAVGMLVALPLVAESMRSMQQFVREHPDQATVASGPGSYSVQIRGDHPELMPDFSSFLLVAIAENAVVVALLAAAITRRLHDTDHRGWWALLPLPFAISGIFLMLRLFSTMTSATEPDSLFFAAFANNVIYLGLAAFLVLLLVRPGTEGPNRFGPEPEAN